MAKKCIDNGLVSANRLRKYLNCGTSIAVNHCKSLENHYLIKNLGKRRGRVITEIGYEFLDYVLKEENEKETIKAEVIPLFEQE